MQPDVAPEGLNLLPAVFDFSRRTTTVLSTPDDLAKWEETMAGVLGLVVSRLNGAGTDTSTETKGGKDPDGGVQQDDCDMGNDGDPVSY